MANKDALPDPCSQIRVIEAVIVHKDIFGPALDVDRLRKLIEAWKQAAEAQTGDDCIRAMTIYGVLTIPKSKIKATFIKQFARYWSDKGDKLLKAERRVKESAPKEKKSIKEGHDTEHLWTVVEEVSSFARKLNSFCKITMAGPVTGQSFITVKLDKTNPSYRDDYDRLQEKYNIYYDVTIKPDPDPEQETTTTTTTTTETGVM